jgi:2-iminoacetate synthase
MEFSVPGFIKRYCTPNALLTLAEYLEDYAPADTAAKGWALIEKNLESELEPRQARQTRQRLDRIRKGERDIYF